MGKPLRGKRPIKKTKIVVKFDEDARKDYLTGFHKRKQERRSIAAQSIEKKLKHKVQQERNKRRSATKAKVDEIMKGIGLFDEPVSHVTSSNVEKVEFDSHEVTINTNVDFTDTGLVMGNSRPESEDSSKVKSCLKKSIPSKENRTQPAKTKIPASKKHRKDKKRHDKKKTFSKKAKSKKKR